MQLSDAELSEVIRKMEGAPLRPVLRDVCEVLTLKVVLWLKGKREAIKKQRAGLPLGDPEANVLAARINLLGKLIVELAEAP
jgi:hypothetical protein